MSTKKNTPAPAGVTSNPEAVQEAVEQVVEKIAEVTEEVAKAPVALPNAVFEVYGKKYQLSDSCPAKLQFNGKVYQREELLTNNEILISLVIGKSPFVKKV